MAATVTAVFTDLGVTSSWNDATNWLTAFVPDNGNGGDDYDVVIDGDASRLSSVAATSDVSILSLRVDANLVGPADSLSLQNSTNITLTSGGVQNDGRMLFNAAGAFTGLVFEGSQSINGSGEIVMSHNASNEIRGTAATSTIITQGVHHTIRGGGILLNDMGGMVNDGTILAQGSASLRIDPENGLEFVNQGTLRAEGAGGLVFLDGTFTNTGQTIQVGALSKLDLNNGTTLVGGTLSGAGTVNVNGLNPSNVVLDGITNQTTVAQFNGEEGTIKNGLTNDGSWQLNAASSRTGLTFDGGGTLGGSGEFVLNDNHANSIDASSGDVITHGANHTIRGAGGLLDDSGGMVNLGMIRAEGSAQLRIDPETGQTFQNDGKLEAAGSGGLAFSNGTFVNHTSIDVLDGSKLDLNNGTTLQGGTLTTLGSGVIHVNGLTASHVVLDGITNQGSVVQGNSEEATVINGMTNNGAWQVNASGSTTGLEFSGTQTLGGTGSIVMNDNPGGRLLATGGTVTNGASHTIQGGGRIEGSWLNLGTMDVGGSSVLRATSGLMTNDGVIQTSGSGQFEVETSVGGNGTWSAAGGTIQVESTGAITSAGLVEVQSGGQVDVQLGGRSRRRA